MSGSSTVVDSEIGVTKAELGNKEAAGSFTGEIGVTKAELGNKEAAGSCTRGFGVAEAEPLKAAAAGSFTGEIGISKQQAELGNKDAAGGIAMVTEASWIDYVILHKKEQERLGLAPKLQQETDEPTADGLITKETVPDLFIDILTKRRPFNKFPPMTDSVYSILSKYDPKLRELVLKDNARRNCCVDLHYDVLRQYAEKGFAEVGVVFTAGVKKIFVLP